MIKNYTVSAKNLRAAANACYSKSKHGLLAMFANDERQIHGKFAIYCLFDGRNPEEMLSVKALVDDQEAPEYPSLTPIIPAAAWFEREIHDLFGLTALENKDLRPLVLHENWPQGLYPMRKDFAVEAVVPEAHKDFPLAHAHGEGVFEVPVGPIHAGIIEPGHFRFSQAGETTFRLDAKLFFTHRGIEKIVEGQTIEQALFSAERICGACSVSHALSFCQTVESISKAIVPERANVIRVIISELERLYNHIGDVGNLCAGLGFSVGTSHGARLKEHLMRLNDAVTGNRFLRGMIIPGGVRYDLSGGLIEEIYKTLKRTESDFREVVGLLEENDQFLDRVNTTGILPFQAAKELGVVGVAARASGVDYDLRRDKPYSGYAWITCNVPFYRSGDVAARLWVRVDETLESIRIVRQMLERIVLTQTDLAVEIPPLEPYKAGIGWSESARGGNIHWLMTGKDNTIYRYFVRSASYANWPALPVAVPGNIIPDFPLINKSFELCYACLDR